LGERREHLVEALLLVVGRILVEWIDEIFPQRAARNAAHGAAQAIEGLFEACRGEHAERSLRIEFARLVEVAGGQVAAVAGEGQPGAGRLTVGVQIDDAGRRGWGDCRRAGGDNGNGEEEAAELHAVEVEIDPGARSVVRRRTRCEQEAHLPVHAAGDELRRLVAGASLAQVVSCRNQHYAKPAAASDGVVEARAAEGCEGAGARWRQEEHHVDLPAGKGGVAACAGAGAFKAELEVCACGRRRCRRAGWGGRDVS